MSSKAISTLYRELRSLLEASTPASSPEALYGALVALRDAKEPRWRVVAFLENILTDIPFDPPAELEHLADQCIDALDMVYGWTFFLPPWPEEPLQRPSRGPAH